MDAAEVKLKIEDGLMPVSDGLMSSRAGINHISAKLFVYGGTEKMNIEC